MAVCEQNMTAYVDRIGIMHTVLARNASIDRQAMENVFLKRRELRADEFMRCCEALEKTPYDFYPDYKIPERVNNENAT